MIRQIRPLVALSALLLFGFDGWAAESVAVLGLFKNQALVEIDGARELIKKGEIKAGVRLISADSKTAVLEVDGRRGTYRLGSRISSHFSKAKAREVQIWRRHGMFSTVGSINGQTINFLVDTGASSVAMSSKDAKRLGIDYRRIGTEIRVSTASGTAKAYRVVLDRVRVGEIELRLVEAMVLAGDHPKQALLGLTFLNRLEMQNNGQMLLLRQIK